MNTIYIYIYISNRTQLAGGTVFRKQTVLKCFSLFYWLQGKAVIFILNIISLFIREGAKKKLKVTEQSVNGGGTHGRNQNNFFLKKRKWCRMYRNGKICKNILRHFCKGIRKNILLDIFIKYLNFSKYFFFRTKVFFLSRGTYRTPFLWSWNDWS